MCSLSADASFRDVDGPFKDCCVVVHRAFELTDHSRHACHSVEYADECRAMSIAPNRIKQRSPACNFLAIHVSGTWIPASSSLGSDQLRYFPWSPFVSKFDSLVGPYFGDQQTVSLHL